MATATPWGLSQAKQNFAVGINFYSTASHGGFKVSTKKNELIPEYMRNSNGWYEEDCDWAKVVVVFNEYFEIEAYNDACNTLRNWFPDEYEQFFNTVLQEGESRKRDEDLARIRNMNDFVVKWAKGDWDKNVPKGMVGVGFYRESDGATIQKLVEYYDPKMVIKSDDINSYEDYVE